LYVLDENNPNSFGNKKNDKFNKFKRLSDENIQNLVSKTNRKFYEYKDLEK